MANPLSDLQNAVADLLLSQPYFVNVPVVTEDAENYVQIIAEKVAKTIGICTLIRTPWANVKEKNAPLLLDPVGFSVVTYEQPAVNRPVGGNSGTGKSGLDVTLNAMAILHLSNPVANYWGNLCATGFKRFDYVEPNTGKRFQAFEAKFILIVGLNQTLSQVATPVITETSAGHFSISCATPGAAIFYTTDGKTFPAPQNATLYTGPFTATPPVPIYVKAYLTGYTASAYVKQTFTS